MNEEMTTFTSGSDAFSFNLIRPFAVDCACVTASEVKSEDPGFDPLVGQNEGQFFCPSESTLVHICFVPEPLLCVRHAPKMCAHVKDPISICRIKK